MFIIQYPLPDIGNSFCLVVRIFGSERKSLQFYPRTAIVVTRKNTQRLLSVPLLDGSTKNFIYFYIHQTAAPQLLHQALPNSKFMTISQHKVCDALHSTKPARACAHTNRRLQSAHMHAAHLSLPRYSNNIKQAGGCSCSAPYCHHFTVMFIIQYPPPDIANSFV
ncbi:hypothetical protein AVEN_201449-1 [Araneus ventricosus]|uniref:Uncharacterized protein n=1 Tax=Araneus ventricosus TaxID=182803 RepID=A0A4Y2JYL4_ARAVE|nr:hypothetical protein AVEN_201449-1 [Araneus ventricosus]